MNCGKVERDHRGLGQRLPNWLLWVVAWFWLDQFRPGLQTGGCSERGSSSSSRESCPVTGRILKQDQRKGRTKDGGRMEGIWECEAELHCESHPASVRPASVGPPFSWSGFFRILFVCPSSPSYLDVSLQLGSGRFGVSPASSRINILPSSYRRLSPPSPLRSFRVEIIPWSYFLILVYQLALVPEV